ncbi:hypothetical protein GN156_14005 [bacterium LRH843]|nr:hypothetical protein [bacterium LRH843]
MEKELYYVNLNPISMETLSPIKINDGYLIEYEVAVTPSEKKDLENLLREVQAHDMELGSMFTFKHFDETGRIHDKDEYQRGLNDVYEEIYRLGTPETKQQIEEINLINHDQ